MAKRATEKNRATTPVVLGFVVKKRFTNSRGKERSIPVSRRFTSRDVANTFRDVAEKSYTPVDGHTNIEFYTSEDDGFDDILGST